MIISIFKLVTFILIIFIEESQNININESIIKNISEIIYYENLFNSIEYDFYNLSLIYNNSYNSIKIKHKSNVNLYKKEVCILGVLCNDKGLAIHKSMLLWLLPEYDVYCVYQKYPGILFEYPALRFAQWFSLKYNKQIILYLHTKGAFYQRKEQESVIELWKHEFTNKRKNVYINFIKNNSVDISLPFRKRTCTWLNGMFISNRAFKLINEIEYYPNDRWNYENLFAQVNKNSEKIRFKGILNDDIEAKDVLPEKMKYLKYFSNMEKQKKKMNFRLVIFISLLIIVIFLKKLYL